jgi:hypothetical protein
MPSTAKQGQNRLTSDESVSVSASPRQYNAPYGGLIGGIMGLAMGYIFAVIIYDMTLKAFPAAPGDPAWPATIPAWGGVKLILSEILAVFSGKTTWPPLCWFYVPLIPSIALATAGAIYGVKSSWIYAERHIEGPKLVSPEKIPKARKEEAMGIWLGPIQLTREEETQNILTIGKPGGGKTTLIVPMVEQAIERGDRVFVVCFKGDFYERFGHLGKYIAPWNPKSCRWKLGRDITEESDAEAFAEGLVPESDDPIWSQAARGITEGIVMDLQKNKGEEWGWAELAESLTNLLGKPEELQKAITDHRPLIAARLTSMADETRESILINLVAFGESIVSISRTEAKLKNGQWWSVTDWLTGPDKVAIVGWSAQREILSRRIALPIFKLAMQRLLSQRNRKPTDEGYWFFVDEAGQLGEIPNFATSGFSAGRSKGARLVVGFQTMGQITEFYGDQGRNITGCETRVIGRLLNPEDAQDASDICGEQVMERLTVSTTRDGGRTESWPRTPEPVYRAAKFSRLGRCRSGVKLAYIGRNVVSEITFPFLPGITVLDEDELKE